MKVFKIEQSSFFGIFIPGAFLLINIVYAITNLSKGIGITILSLDCKFTFEEGLISFVLTVILGFVLRMLPYEGSDWLRKSKFPYFSFIFEKNWKHFPKSFKDFFDNYALINYPDHEITNKIENSNKMASLNADEAKYLINNLKVSVYLKNAEMKSEILFHEGASRLAVGTLYALVISFILIGVSMFFNVASFKSSLPCICILVSYLGLIATIYSNLSKLRGKEVRTILEAYAQL
jgi:hypothetical protein